MMAHSLAAHPVSALTDSAAESTRPARLTRALLGCGVVAGPLYLALGLAQALTRPGFDLTKHELSQLAVGDWGWVQITNFYVSGLLVIASALGLHRVLRSSRGRTWGPRLVGLYGIGLIGAGIFTADAGLGFPLGTPSEAKTIISHGLQHFACEGIGFCGLIAAAIVFGRRYLSLGQRTWAAYSMATGVVFLVTFVGGAMLSSASATRPFATLMLWIGVLLAWAWLTATSAQLRRHA
jgi:hypothetical protein